MRCNRIQKLLGDYQCGELSAQRAAGVEAHLRSCADCRIELVRLENEAKLYEAYAAKVDSGLTLPAGMLERIRNRSAATARTAGHPWIAGFLAPFSPRIRQAMAAALLVVLSVAGTLLVVDARRGRENAAEVSQNVPSVSGTDNSSLETALKSIERAEEEYLNAIRLLTAIVEEQKPSIDPAVLAGVQANLRLIDEHIAATRKAYYSHPADAELALYMLAAYSRKVELLQELAS